MSHSSDQNSLIHTVLTITPQVHLESSAGDQTVTIGFKYSVIPSETGVYIGHLANSDLTQEWLRQWAAKDRATREQQATAVSRSLGLWAMSAEELEQLRDAFLCDRTSHAQSPTAQPPRATRVNETFRAMLTEYMRLKELEPPSVPWSLAVTQTGVKPETPVWSYSASAGHLY